MIDGNSSPSGRWLRHVPGSISAIPLIDGNYRSII